MVIRSSKSVRSIFPFIYCSIIKLAIGSAHVAPNPAFSTTTAIAICGFSLGAYPTNIEWSFPRLF